MIANLTMYDLPGMRAANDALWASVRSQLGYGPDSLSRVDDMWSVWASPDLLFSQTCGYPYRARLHGTVQLIATPDYDIPDCPPGHYYSVFVAHADDPRDAVADFDGALFAYNEPMSQSGWAAPAHHMAQIGTAPGQRLQSGGHALSARAVAQGDAEFAALDVLTFLLLQEHDPKLTDVLKVVGKTSATPTLPFITGKGQDVDQVRDAVTRGIDGLNTATKSALRLNGVVQIEAAAYLSIPTPPGP